MSKTKKILTLSERRQAETHTLYSEIAQCVVDHPEMSYAEIALSFGCCFNTVRRAVVFAGLSRKRGPKPQTENMKGEK